MTHAFVLRTPWYVLARDPDRDPFASDADSPCVQKYGTVDYVDRLLADPRDSLVFGDEDEWSYPLVTVPRPLPRLSKTRSYRMVRAGMRKLYQPSHDRFYAVVVELFCDEPGLPRPGDVSGLELGFVVRREVMTVEGDTTALRKLAADLVKRLDCEQHQREQDAPEPLDTADLDQVAWAARDRELTPVQASLLAAAKPAWVTEAWTVGADGRGQWSRTDPNAGPQLLPGEEELPMWRLPPSAGSCEAARTRVLWFGAVPTMSADIDTTGRPKLDDQYVYHLRCFARRRPPPGHEHCPDRYWWSAPTSPYRLASFFDPAGTRNRRVSITTPDFRALAARAREPKGPGGVELVQPPGSQLQFTKGKTIPGSGTAGGDGVERCTYALELFTIVAMFLFTLFLPIVTLLFQLWWMLLLRFCRPSTGAALELVTDYLAKNNPVNAMDPAQRAALDEVLGAEGATDLFVSADPEFGTKSKVAAEIVDALHPDAVPTPQPPETEPGVGDPLCGTAMSTPPRAGRKA
ncbi:hypothetical protein ACWD3I_20190 [Streptomyces sp. NPDC002817]|uniref:hypothetical protein n=1 Tax=Streptomyces sp. NPDC088357 TaxID=3154655 RepID=UPI00342DFBCA